MRGTTITRLAGAAALLLALGACGDDEEAVAAAPDADEADEADTDGADDTTEAGADEDEFDASVDPDQIITTITFDGADYDIRDIDCVAMDHHWRLTGYIDTVHAGGDRIMVTENDQYDETQVQLIVRDEDLDREVTWDGATGGFDLDPSATGGVSGTVEVELVAFDDDIDPRDPEPLDIDLSCQDG